MSPSVCSDNKMTKPPRAASPARQGQPPLQFPMTRNADGAAGQTRRVDGPTTTYSRRGSVQEAAKPHPSGRDRKCGGR